MDVLNFTKESFLRFLQAKKVKHIAITNVKYYGDVTITKICFAINVDLERFVDKLFEYFDEEKLYVTYRSSISNTLEISKFNDLNDKVTEVRLELFNKSHNHRYFKQFKIRPSDDFKIIEMVLND